MSTLPEMATPEAVRSVDTSFGVVGVEASAAGLRRVRLPGDGRHVTGSHGQERAEAKVDSIAAQVSEFAHGEREEFEVEIDWDGIDETHRRVLETLREIAPYGETVTYGELGQRAGVEDPRDVGVMMARNPFPLVIPCHRVVASDGLGGFGGGLELKRRLLELEGVLPPRLDLGEV
jgi:methylated-DNA-[protein]-cysteine S-methyltransferase